MMKKSRQLNGMIIIDKKTGAFIGRVRDTIFSPGSRGILGFSISCSKWHNDRKAVKIDNIDKIGTDMIISDKMDCIVEIGDCPDLKNALSEMERVLGLRVVSDSGDELGFLNDILIDEKDMIIDGYSITDGIVEDIINGRTVIPYSDGMVFGRDAVIVHDDGGITLKNDIYLKKILKDKD